MKAEISSLSPAQRQILALIGQGKMTKEIAEIIGVSENGILYHRKRIYRVLGVTCLADCIHTALNSKFKVR